MTGNASDPKSLATDLSCVHNIYADFFAGLTAEDWRLPEKDGGHEMCSPANYAHEATCDCYFEWANYSVWMQRGKI